MSYQWKKEVLIESQEVVANIESNPFHTQQFNHISVQCIWKNLTGTLNGTFSVLGSNNGVDFDEVVIPVNINTANGNDVILINSFPLVFIKVMFTINGITGGTFETILCEKEGK